MIIISHRGNLDGVDPIYENMPDYIEKAIQQGFQVEVDVWIKNNKIFLGHDRPQYKINLSFLKNKKLWCHAKNFEAMDIMLKNKIHCFWHETDKMCLTSKKIIWCYPGTFIRGGITVVLNKNKNNLKNFCYGICTDYPNYYLNFLK